MPESGAGDLSPDGTRVVYSPLFRDFRTWKRYEGGWAQELYVFDRETHDVERVTDHPRADRDPMWIGDAIYFTSDRDGTLNLYAFDLGTSETTQLTNSTLWDVRWPGDDGRNRIVYEMNGELHLFTIDSGESRPIPIVVPDDGVAARPARVPASGQIEDFELSPKGERALFVARGDVFTAPIENGPTRNLTRSSDAHDKWARWSPDGSRIAFVSDRDGEDEIYVVRPGRRRVPGAADGRRRGDALRAGVVARRGSSGVQRQGRQALRPRRRVAGDDPRRRRGERAGAATTCGRRGAATSRSPSPTRPASAPSTSGSGPAGRCAR